MPSLYSALLLTGLLAVGLFFFLRASIKDRTESLPLVVNSADLPHRVRQYLQNRGYRLVTLDGDSDTVVFEGQVRFSVGVLILLSLLGGIGAACLGLVLSILLPELWQLPLEIATVAIATIGTGIFYALGANRTEQVKLIAQPNDRLLVIAHRDELSQLQRSLSLPE